MGRNGADRQNEGEAERAEQTMEQFYSWVQTILFYMIFMNFMTNLLPGKAYAKYVRLFMGMVLILLVIRPLTESLRLDDQLARRFEEISFQEEAGELQGQLEEIERQRLEAIADEYEKTVSVQAEARLEKRGYRGAEVKVSVDREQDSDSFGMIEEMEVSVEDVETWEYSAGEMPESDEINNQLKQLEKTQQLKQTKQSEKEQEIRQVSIEKNQIQVHLGNKEESEEKGKEGDEGQERLENSCGADTGDPDAEAAIRKELADFYGLEERHIKIQIRD